MDDNTPPEDSTTQSKAGITFHAAHLNIPIDPSQPRPSPSEPFLSLRQQVSTTWHTLEAAEHRLIAIDDTIDEAILNYISAANRKTTPQELWAERYRLTVQKYGPAIEELERGCKELESGIEALEKAAQEEQETLEGKAALEIDVGLLRKCLGTIGEIVDGARGQMEQARARLG